MGTYGADSSFPEKPPKKEFAMFARKVAARLKPDSLTEFTDLVEYEILPWLRRQKGFLDLIVLAAPHSREVATVSFWDREENEAAFSSAGFPEVLNTLGDLLDGAPYVKTFDVVSSTLQSSSLTMAGTPRTTAPKSNPHRHA
jgi:heme-degrading monooxygenase HmoA